MIRRTLDRIQKEKSPLVEPSVDTHLVTKDRYKLRAENSPKGSYLSLDFTIAGVNQQINYTNISNLVKPLTSPTS